MIGMDDFEQSVYQFLLTTGPQPASNVAKRLQIPRISAYHLLERMEKKNWVEIMKNPKIKHFSAVNPKTILNQKLAEANDIRSALPELLALINTDGAKPKVQFYDDIKGILRVYEALLKAPNKEIVSFTNTEALKIIPEAFLKAHFQARLAAGIKTRIITQKRGANLFEEPHFSPYFRSSLWEVLFLKGNHFPFPAEITICGGNIAIISYGPRPIAILIEQQDLYKTLRSIFDLAWLGATSFII